MVLLGGHNPCPHLELGKAWPWHPCRCAWQAVAGLLGHDVLSVLGSASAPPPPPQAGPQVRSAVSWCGGTMAWEGEGGAQYPLSGLQRPPAGSPTPFPLSLNLFYSFLSPFSLPVCTWLAESLAGGGCLLPLTAQRTAVGTPLCLSRGCDLKSVAAPPTHTCPGSQGCSLLGFLGSPWPPPVTWCFSLTSPPTALHP